MTNYAPQAPIKFTHNNPKGLCCPNFAAISQTPIPNINGLFQDDQNTGIIMRQRRFGQRPHFHKIQAQHIFAAAINN
ncbi:MAG: hypothetical protein R6X34_30480 [Chloroflexota bacterium]